MPQPAAVRPTHRHGTRRAVTFALTAALAASACSPMPSPPPSVASSPSGEPTATSTAAAGRPIVYGAVIPGFAPSPLLAISNTAPPGFRPPGGRADLPVQLVYNGIYRWDDSFAPVPDLAAEPCTVASDRVSISCRLVETTFHDGTPLTADDVAFTYELARRHPDCLFAMGTCVGDIVESVSAPDDRTVEFRLVRPDATFLTLVLPEVMIDSRAAIEAAYAPLAERAATLDPAVYGAAAGAIVEQLQAAEPDCAAAIEGTDALFAAAGLEPLPRDRFTGANGGFDTCLYAEYTAPLLGAIEASVGATGLDAISLAYPALSSNRAPIGTGPWRFVGVEGGDRGVFEAFEGFHRGAPATPRIEIVVYRDSARAFEGLRDGELTWLTPPLREPELVDEARKLPGLKFASFPESDFTGLMYNLREGRLFADPNLRAAIEICIDKPQTVDAATDGRGNVAYSPISPISWAYQPDLVRPERDVAAARRLIESSGWVDGDDGIYVRGDRRLATKVYVFGGFAERVEFMDLVAAQVRDCGVELDVVQADQESVIGPLERYPHVAPGQDDPFDAVFVGWAMGFDPDNPLFHSRTISSETQPNGLNVMGFSDPRVDELLDRGLATYDQRERARIYREFQDLIAATRPVLFGWSSTTTEALSTQLRLTDGEPNLASRQWPWELEKLVVRD